MAADSARIRTLLVDDEPAGREGLRLLASSESGLEIVGECADGATSVARLRAGEVDLVFLDVGLPDFSGLEVVRRVGVERMPAVIFVTAHHEAAVAAFELAALDFLTKPVARARFAAAVERFRRRRATGDRLAEQLERLLSTAGLDPGPEVLTIRSGNRLLLVPTEEIDWVAAEGNYARVHHCGKSHLLAKPFAEAAERLGCRRFILIRRGLLVAKARVREIRFLSNGTARLLLADGTELLASRRHRGAIESLAASR